MRSYALLLRAVNVGGRNTLAMADLRVALTGLGYGDVRTVLNTGNATFSCAQTRPAAITKDVESALRTGVGVDVRAWVRPRQVVEAALDALPPLGGYVLVTMLLARPEPARLRAVLDADWSPETVRGNERVLYLSYADGLRGSKLTNARLEKLLGVGCTGRTPATLRKLVAGAAPPGQAATTAPRPGTR